MRRYTPRELRAAIFLAVFLTALAVIALLDPSCQPRTDIPNTGPTRSLAPH